MGRHNYGDYRSERKIEYKLNRQLNESQEDFEDRLSKKWNVPRSRVKEILNERRKRFQ